MNKDRARIKTIICSTCSSFPDCECKCKSRDRVADALIADGFTKYNGENDYKQRLTASEERYKQLSNTAVEAIEKKNKRIKKLEAEKKIGIKDLAEKLKSTILERAEVVRDWTDEQPRLRREIDVDVFLKEIDNLLEDCIND